MEWNGKPYHSLDYELRQQFGRKIYKLSLDGGMSCPNRDGTLGTGAHRVLILPISSPTPIRTLPCPI